MTNFPGEMKLDVRLSDEIASVHFVKLAVRSPAEGETASRRPSVWRRARDVVPAFLEAIDLGLFNGTPDQRAEVLHTRAHEQDGERAESWELKLPPIDPDAFGMLARMLWAASAREVRISENAREERLTVHALPPSHTARPTPWEVVKHIGDESKDATVTVCFVQDPPAEIVTETHQVLTVWGALLMYGGFAGASGFPLSAAVLRECGTELANEVFAAFEAIAVSPEGWGPLWNGLRRIHGRATIARVEVR